MLTLEVGSTARDPWLRTFDAAHGAHVLASVSSEAEAGSIANLPGVAERDRPVPLAPATMLVDGREVRVLLAGLDGQPQINVPVPIEGSGVRAGTTSSNRVSRRRSGSQSERRSHSGGLRGSARGRS